MRFGLRLALWGFTAALEQLLLLAVAAVAVAAVTTVVVAVVGSLVVRALLPSIDRRLDREWAASVAPLSSFPDQEPRASLNQTAEHLEAVAAALGIDLAPARLPGRPHPSSDAVATFSHVSKDLLTVGLGDPASEGAATVPETYRAWHEQRQATIAEAIAVLLGDQEPRWDNDLRQFAAGPDTDLQGQLWLHRVLVAEAWLAAADGDRSRSGRALEASWRLNRQLLACPQLEVYQVAMAAFELQAAALRRIPDQSHDWQDRLRSVDPPQQVRRGYLCRTWQLRRSAETFWGEQHPVLAVVVQPFARLVAVHHHQAMAGAVKDLNRQNPLTFDPAVFAAVQFAPIPRWDAFSRSAMPTTWSSWSDSVRSGLVAELTRRVLRVRELYAEGGARALGALQDRQPSQVSGLDWHYQVQERRVTIALAGDPFAARPPFPLNETVVLEPGARNGAVLQERELPGEG